MTQCSLLTVQQLTTAVHGLNLLRWVFFLFLWRWGPTGVMTSSFLRFLDHTQLRTIFGRAPVDGWSAHLRDLCLTTHNIQNKRPFARWDSNPQSQKRLRLRAATGTSTVDYVTVCNVVSEHGTSVPNVWIYATRQVNMNSHKTTFCIRIDVAKLCNVRGAFNNLST